MNRVLLEGPLILPTNLLFLLWSEIILDVERLSNFLWSLSFDHVGHSLACEIQQALDVQVVSSLNELGIAKHTSIIHKQQRKAPNTENLGNGSELQKVR